MNETVYQAFTDLCLATVGHYLEKQSVTSIRDSIHLPTTKAFPYYVILWSSRTSKEGFLIPPIWFGLAFLRIRLPCSDPTTDDLNSMVELAGGTSSLLSRTNAVSF